MNRRILFILKCLNSVHSLYSRCLVLLQCLVLFCPILSLIHLLIHLFYWSYINNESNQMLYMRMTIVFFSFILPLPASGLQYLRETGIVHRDIKPGNILLYKSEDGRLVYWTFYWGCLFTGVRVCFTYFGQPSVYCISSGVLFSLHETDSCGV